MVFVRTRPMSGEVSQKKKGDREEEKTGREILRHIPIFIDEGVEHQQDDHLEVLLRPCLHHVRERVVSRP